MNKILKILSILVIGFVMFSCSTPTNDPTLYNPEESGPETPDETPSVDPVEETPAVPTYSIIFTPKDSQDPILHIFADYLNTLPEFKNLEEGTEVILLKHLYTNTDESEITKEIVEASAFNVFFYYDNNNPGINSVVIGNEDVEVEVIFKNATDDLSEEECNLRF